MNRFLRFEYNYAELPPISDYKNQPVLSLESALEPVLSYVDQLDFYMKKAKKGRRYPSEHDLTEDESSAVYLYTDDWGDQSLHRVLNQALQSEDRTKMTPWFGFLKLFNSALEKLPSVKSTIWLGLPIDVVKKFEAKGEFVCWGVISCSSSIDVIKCLLDHSSLLCSIEPLNGKNVNGYTPHIADHEVLLLPGIHLRVKSKGSDNLGIDLEEISVVCDDQVEPSDIEMPESVDGKETKDVQEMETEPLITTNGMNNEPISNNKEAKENKTSAVITFSNGGRYKVAYKNGKKLDYGRYNSINGEIVEGEAAGSKANGEGICVFPNGDRFIGTFKHGSRHGHGILYQVNGSIIAGDWANDESTGRCLKIISSSDRYEWRDEGDKKRWYGAYYDDNGNTYIGSVANGKANGLGIRICSDNSQYEGNFKDDKKNGYGIYFYTDRDKYMGQWINDEINGEGKLTWTSGTRYKGSFVNGKRHGQGKLTFANKRKQEGCWENDQLVT